MIADLDSDRLAEHLSRMMLVLSVVPVLAPAIGGLALSLTSWRGLFLALAAVGLVLLVVVRRLLPESRPEHPTQDDGGLRQVVLIARKPAFLLPAVVSGAGFGVMFSYIGDSAFVFRDHYAMGAAAYGLLFGANACALIAGFQIGPRLKRRWGTRRVLLLATAVGSTSGSAMVAISLLFPRSVAPVVATLMPILACAGVLIPLATAAAIDAHPDHVAGASGLSGALQFLIGGTLATIPVALDLGDGAAPLGGACAICLIAAFILVLVSLRDPAVDVVEPTGLPASLPTVIPIPTVIGADDVAGQTAV